jgi:hypothetical protein
MELSIRKKEMCRNIKVLRQPDGVPTDEELKAAALQFVRKISGYRKPSRANEQVFHKTVDDIANCAKSMFHGFQKI